VRANLMASDVFSTAEQDGGHFYRPLMVPSNRLNSVA